MKSIILTLVLVFCVGIAHCADSDSALKEVRDRLTELGLVEEFNPATEEIVGVGSASGFTDGSDCGAGGWLEQSINLFTVARAKAAMEVSKVLSMNLSAGRVLDQSSRPGSRYKALARVVKVRTEGRPIGCKIIAQSVKNQGGKIQVAVALKWSLKTEEETVRSFIQPQSIDEDELENWAEKNDMISKVGPYFWSDDKGRVCFMGIGVGEIKGDDPKSVKTGMRLANIRARRYLTQCFLEAISAEEIVQKKTFTKTTGGETIQSRSSSYTVDINTAVKGLMMPGATQIFSDTGCKSPFTGKRLCVYVYALTANSAKGEIRKRLSGE